MWLDSEKGPLSRYLSEKGGHQGGSYPNMDPAPHLQGGTADKEPACQCRRHKRHGSTTGWGRCPGGGHGNPLQYSCQENPMDRGVWQAAVHTATQSWIRLKQLSMHKSTYLTPLCFSSERHDKVLTHPFPLLLLLPDEPWFSSACPSVVHRSFLLGIVNDTLWRSSPDLLASSHLKDNKICFSNTAMNFRYCSGYTVDAG